jgi:hypothetical protein
MPSESELRIENGELRKQKRGVAFFILNSAFCILLAACGAVPSPNPQENVFPSPVAFVTAAPLLAPSATPTLEPLPTATLVPPTAVPKELPQESTSTIGLWSDRVDSAQGFPGFLDLARGPGSIEYQQQRNQRLKALASFQVYKGFEDRLGDVQANHPDWLLYDKNKKVASSGDDNQPLLNIRSDEVKNQLAEEVARLITDKNYDGIVLDGVGKDLIRSNSPPVYTGTKTFTEDQRRDAAEGLLRTIRARIPDRMLIVGGYAWKDGAAYGARSNDAQNLATLADGVHIEEFLRSPISKTNEFRSEANWKKDVDYLSAISQDNKIVLTTTRLDASGAPSETVRQWLNYSVASYLLGKNGAHTYFQFDAGDPAYSNDAILSAPIGAPIEPYTKLQGGIYQRKFDKGLVLVNPSSEQRKTNLDGEYKTLAGNSVDVSVTLGPRSGLILLKS